jgi:putative membrane protein
MFDPVLSSLPAFASFFLTAVVLLAVFLGLYVFVTPYSELRLIGEGNTAAAVSLGGAVIGFALPIAVAVAISHNLYAMFGWGVVACVVQLLTFSAARLALPTINHNIPQGKLASGIFLASLSIGVGILNAGCIA